jgi:NADPH2:quinone reductase
MKAAVQTGYTGISSVQISELNEPTPGPLATLVNVAYAPVLPWDIMGEEGQLGAQEQRSLPSIAGYGASGIVKSAGMLGARSLIGQRVIALSPHGSNTEVMTAPLALYVIPVPDNVDLKQAATVLAGADTAQMLLNQATIHDGDHVAVIGATGGVGIYLVQLLANSGHQPDVVASTRSADFARKTFPHSTIITDLAQSSTHYNVIFDLTGNATQINAGEQALLPGGLLVAASTPGYRPHRPGIRGSFHNGPLSPMAYRKLLAQISSGELTPVVDEVYPLERIREAQRHVKEGPHRGRTLLEVNPQH